MQFPEESERAKSLKLRVAGEGNVSGIPGIFRGSDAERMNDVT